MTSVSELDTEMKQHQLLLVGVQDKELVADCITEEWKSNLGYIAGSPIAFMKSACSSFSIALNAHGFRERHNVVNDFNFFTMAVTPPSSIMVLVYFVINLWMAECMAMI